MLVWHGRKVQPADEMIDAKCFHEALDLGNAILWIPYNEAVVAQRVKCDRGLILRTDERMFPATAIFIAVIDHHILFGKFPGAFARFRNDHLASEWIGCIRG